MKNRYYFLDNLRWATVLLVLFYHVFYNFNSVGVFGGVGGFAEHQWQDTFCALLNPWFMTLLFVVAGASSRYALRTRTTKEFRKERVRKLLIPTTLGLFVFGWILGLMNSREAFAQLPEEVPLIVHYLIAIPSGIAHLWFLQDLLLFSLLLLWVRRWLDVERVDAWLSRLSQSALWALMALFFFVLWGASQSQVDNPELWHGPINLYRPVYYLATFLAGYYIFSSERIHSLLAERARVLLTVGLVTAVGFCVEFYDRDYTSPEAVQSVWCNLFCWSAVLAVLGAFKRWADGTSPVVTYLSRSSFGVYVVHMTVCTGICLALKGSALPVWAIYVTSLVVTFVGSFALWELLRRVPLVRYCVFGIDGRRGRVGAKNE